MNDPRVWAGTLVFRVSNCCLGVGLSVAVWVRVMWSVLYGGWCGVCCAVFQVPLQSSFLFEVRALRPFSSGFMIMGQNIAAYVPPARPTKILRCTDSWCVAGWNWRVWAWIWSESQESYWGGVFLAWVDPLAMKPGEWFTHLSPQVKTNTVTYCPLPLQEGEKVLVIPETIMITSETAQNGPLG